MSAAALTLSLAELCAVILTIWATFDFRRTVNQRNEGRQTLLAVDTAHIALLDAETGQRGYLITADERFLEPYHRGLQALDSALKDLGSRVGQRPDEAPQYHLLASLAGQKRAELALALGARVQGQSPQQIASLVDNATGKELMDEYRRVEASLRASIARRVADAERRADDRGSLAAMLSAGLAILTVATLLVLNYTLRRRSDAATLRRSSAAKDEFVGFVAHELRSPIAIIAGNARHLAQEGGGEDPDRDASIEEILRAAERLEAIVATLLALAKAEAGGQLGVEPVLIQRVAALVLRHHRSRFPGREVKLLGGDDVPPVMGARDAIEQVLVNLLNNAEKYGHATAPITVEIVQAFPREVTVTVANEGGVLDAALFSRVFEPFFRMPSSAAAADGVGLGLTVCHRLIAAQGGTMSAEATAAGGARFSFRLPVAEDVAD